MTCIPLIFFSWLHSLAACVAICKFGFAPFFSLASRACCIRAGRENQFKGAIYPAKLIRLIEKVVERLARVKDGFAAFGLKVYSVFWGGNTWFWFSSSFFLRQNSGEIYGLWTRKRKELGGEISRVKWDRGKAARETEEAYSGSPVRFTVKVGNILIPSSHTPFIFESLRPRRQILQ